MGPEHAELYQRIAEHPLDEPGASQTFAQRLARDNGWTLAYAMRVIAEYRKFVFLAIAAGHPVSPSDPIDQAWHLHLLRTESYWNHFCPEVLGRPLHHSPTKGGRVESDKYQDWYRRTLASYRAFFQAAPPPDIWPKPDVRFGADGHFVRVNTCRTWVIRRPRGWRILAGVALVGLLFFSSGCAAVRAITFQTLSGSEYLRFYMAGMAVAIGMAFALRRVLRGPGGELSAEAGPLHPLEVVRLAANRRQTAHAAIASLVHGKAVELVRLEGGRWTSCRTGYVLMAKGSLRANAHPLEQAIHAAAKFHLFGIDVAAAVESSQSEMDAIEERLMDFELFNARLRALAVVVAHLPPFGILFVLGLNRLLYGVERGRPVGTLTSFLWYTAFMAIMATAVSIARFTRQSRRGDRTLKNWKVAHAELPAQIRDQPGQVEPIALGLAVGLFGIAALPNLADEPLRGLRNALQTIEWHGGSASSDWSSSGGGGGCGSGGGGCGSGGGGGCGG